VNDRDFFGDLLRTDPWIAGITAERIGRALDGFTLDPAPDWDFSRLADAIQGVANAARGEPPQSDSSARTELASLADKAKALRRGIGRLGDTAELAAFFDLARRLGDDGKVSQIDYDDDYKRLMLQPLETIEATLRRAASQLSTHRQQPPRWREKSRQDRRVGFAIALMDVFEQAFDTPARANNWAAAYGEEHPWPDFYRRIYRELMPDETRLNIAEVLQEAARQKPQIEAFLRAMEATPDRDFDK
jgi:hypothetical protein